MTHRNLDVFLEERQTKNEKITIIIFVHFTCWVRLKKYVYNRDVKLENVK